MKDPSRGPSTDPSKAMQELNDVKGRDAEDVDRAGMAADGALNQICARYNLRKDFEIRADSAPGKNRPLVLSERGAADQSIAR